MFVDGLVWWTALASSLPGEGPVLVVIDVDIASTWPLLG